MIARLKVALCGAAVWQPTALNLLFLSCVTDVRVIITMLVERFVLTEIKIIIIIIIIANDRQREQCQSHV